MRILVDDERSLLPDGSKPDLIVRTYDAAVELWVCSDIDWDELYLDHDLGDTSTGYDFICLLEKEALHDEELPGKIICVSDNGPGRARIEQVIQKLYGRLFYV